MVRDEEDAFMSSRVGLHVQLLTIAYDRRAAFGSNLPLRPSHRRSLSYIYIYISSLCTSLEEGDELARARFYTSCSTNRLASLSSSGPL